MSTAFVDQSFEEMIEENEFARTEPKRTSVLKAPPEGEFPENGFLRAPDLERRAAELCDTYLKLSDARDVSFRCYWKKKGGGGDSPVLGKCAKATGVIALETKAQYIIWLAADHLHMSDDRFIEAALYHELRHILIDEDEKGNEHQKLGKHDVEMFNDELEVYGLWRNVLRHTARAFGQLTLTDD